MRYETDGTVTILAAWSRDGRHLPIGSRWPLEGDTVASAVLGTGRPHRQESYSASGGALAEALREAGVRSSVGSPVVVEGRLWGVMVGASYAAEPSTGCRAAWRVHLRAGMAVATVESRGEPDRIAGPIVDSDRADMHRTRSDDGVQQRLVSPAFTLAEALAEPERALAMSLSSLVTAWSRSTSSARSDGDPPGDPSEGGCARFRHVVDGLRCRWSFEVRDTAACRPVRCAPRCCLEVLINAGLHASGHLTPVDLSWTRTPFA
jgi:hypothetical protein